jgi:hypothetical protein
MEVRVYLVVIYDGSIWRDISRKGAAVADYLGTTCQQLAKFRLREEGLSFQNHDGLMLA